MIRRTTRAVSVGNVIIGGGSPVSIQSMTNLPIEKIDENIDQINRMAKSGASIVRLALLTVDSAAHLRKIIQNVSIPLCADIHFDYRIALAAIEAGIAKIRINPGNIGSIERTREVAKAASERKVPIRIGVNGGSIDRTKYTHPTPDALVDSALSHVRILEDVGFEDIVVSIKASSIEDTVVANRIFAAKRNYPIHVGLTEAGYGLACTVQSSIAIGSLLLDGIGDTIRVSLTGDPVDEIPIAREILKSLGLVKHGIRIVSCPSCGRTDSTIDFAAIARSVDEALTARFNELLREKGRLITVAVMGCEVNGPGEASHADVGIAGARSGSFLLFKRGEKIAKVPHSDVVERMCAEVEKILRG